MTSFSCEPWPTKPSQITHLSCGAQWDLYCLDWPPKIVVCPACRQALKLIAHDPDTHQLSYRRITHD